MEWVTISVVSLITLDNLAREANDLVGTFRVERCGMLVEQQQLRFQPRSHQQRQRLPLPAGQSPNGVFDPILKSHVQ